MFDFSKYTKGDVVSVHCCDSCARNAGIRPKSPADSGNASWLCDVCGHHGIGSHMDCEISDWWRLRPRRYNDEAIRAEIARLNAALKKANAQAEHFEREWYLRGDALEDLARYFTSGNDVPVERATINAEDFWRITGMSPAGQNPKASPSKTMISGDPPWWHEQIAKEAASSKEMMDAQNGYTKHTLTVIRAAHNYVQNRNEDTLHKLVSAVEGGGS